MKKRDPDQYDIMVPGRAAARFTKFTKSEARAEMKRMLGIPQKGRLPRGTVAVKVDK